MKVLDLRHNRFLATLPGQDLEALIRKGHMISRSMGSILCEAGEVPEYAYFPCNGIISLSVTMQSERTIQTSMIGREGVFAGMIGFGTYVSIVRATVRSAVDMLCVPAPALRKLVTEHKSIAKLCVRSNDALLAQAYVAAACNALHSIESKLCRLLLEMNDRIGNGTITATQEVLADMLGVRRTSVTEVATKLKSEGVIENTRGNITVLERHKLEKMSCECYATLRRRNAC